MGADDGIGSYGTPLALMLLPYWTDGRIASMEGLYYESSATTPYHFMAVATLAGPGNACNPQVGLPYRTIEDFDVGVAYLQALGVRYYIAESEAAKQAAASNPDLVRVATSPDLDGLKPLAWEIYEVRDSKLVEGLPFEPVVVPGVPRGTGRTTSRCRGGTRPPPTPVDARGLDILGRPLVADGPEEWKRARPPGVTQADAPDPSLPANNRLPLEAAPRWRSAGIRTTDDSVSFHVSRTGVPVMVKTSYFPNWKVPAPRAVAGDAELHGRGATSKDVTLDVPTTRPELLGPRRALVLGILGVGAARAPALVRRKRRRRGSGRVPGAGACGIGATSR